MSVRKTTGGNGSGKKLWMRIAVLLLAAAIFAGFILLPLLSNT